jgi:hypothetical protein
VSLPTRSLIGLLLLALAGPVSAFAADACSTIGPNDIAKATGITVSAGDPGKPIPGVQSRCTWIGSDGTKVILTLTDTDHAKLTIQAQQQSGGSAVSGVGSEAVGVKGAGFTGGGYIITALDSKGGFGVSILGKAGNQESTTALAKLVATKR